MDRAERAIEAALADFRDQLEAWPYAEPPQPGEAGLLRRAARGAGTFAINLGGLLALALLVGITAGAARLGWELLG